MSLLKISEIFGHAVENLNDLANEDRRLKRCPFKNTDCTKSSKKDPLGICSLSDGSKATVTCPIRFTENSKIFLDSATIAFGKDKNVAIVPEVRILKIQDQKGKEKKIGKVDYILAELSEDNQVIDFAALEVQGVYFSGKSIRGPFRHFLRTGNLGPDSERRPDYRSSAQKRLMPQLQLKLPVFRRWGKKFFVVVDELFFNALPPFKTTSTANSEITWLVYPFKFRENKYEMGTPKIVYSEWDEIKNALREGLAPEPQEVINELQLKISDAKFDGSKIFNT